MSIANEVVCRIINSQLPIILTFTGTKSSIPENANKSLIKALIREVEVPDEYFGDLNLLYNLATEYARVTAKNINLTIENSKSWVQSSDICELTYVLKWVIETDNLKGNLHFLPEIQVGDTLKVMILLNIAREIEHVFTIQQLSQLLTENSEIFYLISEQFLKIIDDCTFEERQQFLINMQKLIDKNPQNQICFLRLLQKLYCSYENELAIIFPNFSLDPLINQIPWQDYTTFLIEQQRFPILYQRNSRIVYEWQEKNQENEFNQFSNTFVSEIQSLISTRSLQILLQSTEENQDEEQDETSLVMRSCRSTQRRRKTVSLIGSQKSIRQQQNQDSPVQRTPIAPCKLPPPLLPQPKKAGTSAIKQYPMLHLNVFKAIEKTVWSVVEEVPISEEVLVRFKNKVKKPEAQQQQQQQKAKTYLDPAKSQNIEVVRYQLNKLPNFEEILTQIEFLQLSEFQNSGQDDQDQEINQQSLKIIGLLMQFVKNLDEQANDIKKKYEDEKKKEIPELHENDKFILKLQQVNSKKAIEIYSFRFNYLEDCEYIQKKVTQYRDILINLKEDKQLITYFSFVIKYAKIFAANPQLAGIKLHEVQNLSYRTQDGESEELAVIIVSEMRKMGIKFSRDQLTQLEELSDEKNAMSIIQVYIKRYSDQITLLESLTFDHEDETIRENQKNVITLYLSQYKESKELIEVIHNNIEELYHNLRLFYVDDMKPKESHLFFKEILTLKQQLIKYNDQIEAKESIKRRLIQRKHRETGKKEKQIEEK